MRRSVVALCCLGFLPFSASGLGLGDIALDSHLNEPFNAQIPVKSYAEAELAGLEVGLASRETFDRYGIDLPLFMQEFSFAVVNDAAAPFIRVTSQRPVAEPFVTLLLDVKWGSGRLLREYTVLLDPPLFEAAPVQAAVAPAQTGVTTPDATAGAVTRAAPAPAPVPAPQPATSAAATPAPLAQSAPAAPVKPEPAESPVARIEPATPAAAAAPTAAPVAAVGGEYRVQRRDTLWGIAERVRGDADLTINQVMLALYRANPEAFLGNINRLKAGAILRVPASDELGARTPDDATAEVARQYSEFDSGASPAPQSEPAEPARLTLVAPEPDVAVETQPAAVTRAADSAAAAEREAAAAATTAALEAEAAGMESRIVELETSLGDSQRALEVRDAELAALQARIAALEQQATGGQAEGTTESPVFADEPEVSAAVPDAAPRPAPAAAPAAQPSFVAELFTNLWFWVSAAVAMLLALFVARRRKAAADDADTGWAGVIPPGGAEPADDEMDDDYPAFDDSTVVEEQELTPEATQEVRALIDERSAKAANATADLADEAETASEETTALPGPRGTSANLAAEAADRETPLEKTISTGGPMDLDGADPIAEAEFHMAYGLYDQAADLLEKALQGNPSNRALRTKLIEVFFVWENREGFLRHARALHDTLGGESDAEWNKVVILGKQLCPDEALFSGAAQALPASDVMDFGLSEGGDTELDFTLAGQLDDAAGDGSDGGDATARADALDFDFGDDATADIPDSATTIASPEVAGGDTVETPTIEAQADAGETVEMSAFASSFADEDEGDLELGGADDLDIDLTGFSAGLDDEGDDDLTSMLSAEDEATLLTKSATTADDSDAELAAELESEIEAQLGGAGTDHGEADLTAELEAAIEAEIGIPDEVGDDTVEQPAAGESVDATVDFDLGLDGEDDDAGDDAATAIAELALPEDATMTEVGTKLDLARAYIDMGDPDGARSILNEVLDEGADDQQQEARQLLEELGD